MRHLTLAVLVAAAVACDQLARTPAPPAPTITTAPLSWKINADYAFNASGTAAIQISDSSHAYLLVYRVYWTKKLDPTEPPDTVDAVAMLVPVLSYEVEINDYAARCQRREYVPDPEGCLREANDPEATLELVGWVRLNRPGDRP